jgi:hypothetical protein
VINHTFIRWDFIWILIFKNTLKEAGGVDLAVEHLPGEKQEMFLFLSFLSTSPYSTLLY